MEADSLNKLFKIALAMHKKAFANGIKRVLTDIKIDDRIDKKATIESKVNAVKKRLKI